MVLNNSNLFSESFNQIEAFLKTNISDPKNRHKKRWIYSSEPFVNDKGFKGYPYIVISIDMTEDTRSFDRSTSNKTFRVLLTVRAKDSSKLDTISDEIISKFRDETLTDSLSDFKTISIDTTPFETSLDQNGEKVVSRLIGLVGEKRI